MNYYVHRLLRKVADQPDIRGWGDLVVLQRSLAMGRNPNSYVVLPESMKRDQVYEFRRKHNMLPNVLFHLPNGLHPSQVSLYSNDPNAVREVRQEYPNLPRGIPEVPIMSKKHLYEPINPLRRYPCLQTNRGVSIPSGRHARTYLGLTIAYWRHLLKYRSFPVLGAAEGSSGSGIATKLLQQVGYRILPGGVNVMEKLPITEGPYYGEYSVSVQFSNGRIDDATIQLVDGLGAWGGNVSLCSSNPDYQNCVRWSVAVLEQLRKINPGLTMKGSFDWLNGQHLIDPNLPRECGPTPARLESRSYNLPYHATIAINFGKGKDKMPYQSLESWFKEGGKPVAGHNRPGLIPLAWTNQKAFIGIGARSIQQLEEMMQRYNLRKVKYSQLNMVRQSVSAVL